MFRDQVYNTVGRDRGQLSPNTDTFRRLNRRIHHNMGLLNTSRSSNHSSSFRMGRTELSASRYNSSREREQPSQQISGLTAQEINESKGQIPKKLTSILNLSRRRLNYENSKPMQLHPNGTKNIVQNLYMLTNNQPHHSKGRERSSRPQNFEPQSPRAHANRQYLPEDRRRDNHSKQGASENRLGSHSRESKLGQRQRSKEQSRLRPNAYESSRDRKYNPQAAHQGQKHYDGQIKRLEEKYLENVYELNSPRGRREDKKSRDKELQLRINQQQQQQQYQQQQHQQQQYSKNSANSGSSNTRGANYSTKNMNQYYFQQGQISSTSGGTGVKTLPDPSKVETISQASLPVNSVASQREIGSKGSLTPKVHQKSSIKLDRQKQRNARKQQRKKKEEVQLEPSSLSVRWKMNNIQLQQRKDEKPYKGKEKVIDQGEQDPLPLGSVFLPIQSKREEGRQWADDIMERIILHLECLNMIANYTKEFRKMYDNTEQWQVLIFLSYKKFYIERSKVASILKTPPIKHSQELLFQENPFILPYSKIDNQEIARFRGSRECVALRYEIEAEDTQIRNALRGLYNLYIEKSGEHVNMFDCDNFSEEIYRLMLEEVEGISENLEDSSLLEPTKLRMGKIIQTGLLIAYLNGKYVKNFAQILLHEDTIKIGKRQTLRQDCAADLYLAEFKRVLSS